ncbi:MAG: N-acetyltransferase [Acidimicrobiia bacterium]|nr:N-acetyltransferase [Acidimicrobiia bacterium]
MTDLFVPPSFEIPRSYAWAGLHLEPLGEEHNDRDYEAWMSSIDHIRSTPGFSAQEKPSWPVTMTLESNLKDLVRHARDFEERKGFTYSILDGDDVIGCIYIYPDRGADHDAAISSWVTESRADIDTTVREVLSTWIDTAWPFSNPYYAGIE